MGTNATAVLNAQFEYREIDIDLIEEPELAERETMEPGDLAELAASIASEGLIKPLIVKPCLTGFMVVAGHRRLLACRNAQYSPVPCRVIVKGIFDPLALMVAENAYTEPVNAVEEARFYSTLLEERCEGDVDKLCAMVRRKRGFVEDRLILLMGHEVVITALAQRSISIAVAKMLNKTEDPNRALILTDLAVKGGANARQVAEWVRDANGQEPILLPPDDLAANAAAAAAAGSSASMVCLFCGSPKHAHAMQMVWVHHVCYDNYTDAQKLVNQNNLV